MPPRPDSFQQLLTDAVADFTAHGYDSETRLTEWLALLRAAAEREMVPESEVDMQLRRHLGSLYARLVERGELMGRHPGVQRFTLEQVKPSLHDELERRIRASADLIKLNREDAINATLQRFSGWASSIPEGGSRTVDRRETKYAINKPLSSLAFRERRVLIDQGHKLQANLSEILASDGGAIAGIWHQHHTRYPRVTHKQRDGKIYLIRDSWAHQQGLVKPGPAGYTDEITRPGEEVYCLPGDTLLPFADRVEIAYKRWYSGELTEIVLASGKTLRATPNHPVLTSRGWVPIGQLDKSDYLIEAPEQLINPIVAKFDNNLTVTTIGEAFTAVKSAGIVVKTCGQCSQFHGDGRPDSDVDIVYAARPLTFGGQTLSLQCRQQLDFTVTHYLASSPRPLEFFVDRVAFGFSSLSRRSCEGLSDLYRRVRHSLTHLVTADMAHDTVGVSSQSFSVFHGHIRKTAPGACLNSRFVRRALPAPISWISGFLCAITDTFGRRPPMFSLGVCRPVPLLSIKQVFWSGQVYNLQTNRGWYIANGIVMHNCRCSYQYLYALRRLPDEMLTAKGRATLAQIQQVA